MSVIKEIIKKDIVYHDKLLDKVINEWNSRYKSKLDKLLHKLNIKHQISSGSDTDSECDYNLNITDKKLIYKLIKQAIECKAYAETEYQSIRDIRSELEDCQMIKELGISLRKLEEEKSEQNIKLKSLTGKNMELLQEKQDLEKSLHQLNLKSKIMNGNLSGENLAQSEYVDRKSALAAKLETYTNRTQSSRRVNKNPEYCHIAPNINLFSDSELSISEEDSLEKDKNREGNSMNCVDKKQKIASVINSPDKFESGIRQASKSTPIKEYPNFDTMTNNSRHTSAINNLTQDLKEIQKYFDKKEDESIISPTNILDWEMSQISFDEFKEQIPNGLILEDKEDPDDDQIATCLGSCRDSCCGDEKMIKYASAITSNIMHSSQNFLHKIDCDMGKLQSELREEKEKFFSLSNQISDLYVLVHRSDKLETNEIPTCSGDKFSSNADIPIDPIEQIMKIRVAIDSKFFSEKVMNGNVKLDNVCTDRPNHELYENCMNPSEIMTKSESDDLNAKIFKSLSETSVRLLTEIISNISKVNNALSNKNREVCQSENTDYTLLVTEYLQYLMTLDNINFDNDNCRQHPIYDMVVDLISNAQNITERKSISNEGNEGLSQSLESFYLEQLNKCYDDIKRLKQQLESSQQLLTSKMPIDATQALFEAKQKLQAELESVDREYARQMSREQKRLEESENLYNELLMDHENMQEKYNANINALNQQIEQLERKIEADRRFIDQQQFEWELERTQHSMDMENLNKSLGRIKKSSSCSDNLSDCMESPIKEKIQKSNSLPKSKQRSYSLEITDIPYRENETQTINSDVIILKAHLVFTDLEKYDGFKDLRDEIANNFLILLNFIHLLIDLIFEITEKNKLNISMKVLQEFTTKDLSPIFQINSLQWENMREEILNFRDFLNSFIEEQLILKIDFDKIQEELQISVTNVAIKQDFIKSQEDEIQSLIEFQRNLSKDYDVLQSMLEEKQNELDKLSSKLLSQKTLDEYEETIQNLQKEVIEKQNIIDERDEDLYVLKEDKEIIEQDLQSSKEKYEAIIIQNKDIYQDLEKEVKDYQKSNLELQKQINDSLIKQSEQMKEISNFNEKHDLLFNEVSELNEKNEILVHTNSNIIDEKKLLELRLTEMKEQHRLEILKVNASLEDSEKLNRQLMEQNKINKIFLNNAYCQTDQINTSDINRDSLMNCVSLQDKLVNTIDKLRKEYNREKELRQQVEAKYKHFASQYETLSSKVFLLGNKVNDCKTYTNQDSNDINQSLESIDINDLLNESLDEDIEFKKLIQDCYSSGTNKDEFHQAVATQTESVERMLVVNDNITMVSEFGFTSLSDWLPDLLKEVEMVLQSCIIGDDMPRDMIPKMNKFRELLEQMYKKQLSILLNKISSIEHELQLQRKSSQELKHKSDFIMNELQEKESIQKNLRIRIDQELCTNTRLSETNRNLSDQCRIIKADLSSQILHLKDELERERNKFSDLNRQIRNEQYNREQLEAAVSVANERMKLVEQSNVELIKKSRQQTDFHQKEMDTFNSEYAEIFRRCNSYKIQIESMQQNLQYQILEYEKVKNELQETIQSNTEYRDKMNEFVKIYQERRKKLETEVDELHQLLQISCRREITFVKENETMRVKCQSIKNMCKDYEKKIKELERFVSDLHTKHEEDRQNWLKMINGSIDAKDKDDGILSQVNWLLKMLQLRIELLALHYIPNVSSQDNNNEWEIDSQTKSIFKCRPCSADSTLSRNNSELLMLLQSIQSMQAMINLYLNRGQIKISNNSCNQSSNNKNQLTVPVEKHILNQNNTSNRPKPTGSSDSLDSISDTDSMSDERDPSLNQNIDSISNKIYVIQTNKIIDLQVNLDHCEKWRQQLIDQKKYILSQLSHKIRNFIVTPLLTEQQQLFIHKNFFKFKFKAVIIAVIANIRFARISGSVISKITLSSRLNKVGLQLPQPKFSTSIPINKYSYSTINESKTKCVDNNACNKFLMHSSVKSNGQDYVNRYTEPFVSHFKTNKQKISHTDAQNESMQFNAENRFPTSHSRSNLTPITCSSPIIERQKKVSNNNSFIISRPVHKSTGSNIPISSNSSVNSYRKSLPSPAKRDIVQNSLDRSNTDKSNFSNTLKQIDDFGKRLDKYSDSSNGI